MKIQKKNWGGGGVPGGGVGSGGGGSGWGGQGGCERRIEVFWENSQKNRGVGSGCQVGVGLVGGQGGCEPNVGGRG